MKSAEPADNSEKRNEEFVALLTASHHKLLGYLLSLLGRWHDAQDVLQRASVLMWQKFASFKSGTDFVAWASTVCFYEAKAFQRSASRARWHFDDDLLAVLAGERVEDLHMQERRIEALERCLESLRNDERELLRASCEEHGGIAALGSRLERAPATLYNKLSLLRRLLAACVSDRIQEEPV